VLGHPGEKITEGVAAAQRAWLIVPPAIAPLPVANTPPTMEQASK
jgi:hypothetical protein